MSFGWTIGGRSPIPVPATSAGANPEKSFIERWGSKLTSLALSRSCAGISSHCRLPRPARRGGSVRPTAEPTCCHHGLTPVSRMLKQCGPFGGVETTPSERYTPVIHKPISRAARSKKTLGSSARSLGSRFKRSKRPIKITLRESEAGRQAIDQAEVSSTVRREQLANAILSKDPLIFAIGDWRRSQRCGPSP